MVLVIQELPDQLTLVCNQIQETQVQINEEFLNKDKLKELFTECDQFKEKLESEKKSSKRKKFERDAEDYQKGWVYFWGNPPPRRQRTSQDNPPIFIMQACRLLIPAHKLTTVQLPLFPLLFSSFLEGDLRNGKGWRGHMKKQRGRKKIQGGAKVCLLYLQLTVKILMSVLISNFF